MEMKPGDFVTIYEDPITQTKYEGKAELLERISTINFELEIWWVSFMGETHRTIRAINTNPTVLMNRGKSNVKDS